MEIFKEYAKLLSKKIHQNRSDIKCISIALKAEEISLKHLKEMKAKLINEPTELTKLNRTLRNYCYFEWNGFEIVLEEMKELELQTSQILKKISQISKKLTKKIMERRIESLHQASLNFYNKKLRAAYKIINNDYAKLNGKQAKTAEMKRICEDFHRHQLKKVREINQSTIDIIAEKINEINSDKHLRKFFREIKIIANNAVLKAFKIHSKLKIIKKYLVLRNLFPIFKVFGKKSVVKFVNSEIEIDNNGILELRMFLNFFEKFVVFSRYMKHNWKYRKK